MKNETRKFLGQNLTVGLITVDPRNVSDKDADKFSEQAEDVIIYIMKNEPKLNKEIFYLIGELGFNKTFTAYQFSYVKVLSFLYSSFSVGRPEKGRVN